VPTYENSDFLIIGAGIVGISLGIELLNQHSGKNNNC
jgi:L-2-hydroxyglutarate oxidase LhgO